MPILGGDVYEIIDGKFSNKGEGWSYERKADESYEEYIYNSIEKSIKYITDYPKRYDPNIYFVLVPPLNIE